MSLNSNNSGTIVNRGTTLLTDSVWQSRFRDAVATALPRILSAARVCITHSLRVPLLSLNCA